MCFYFYYLFIIIYYNYISASIWAENRQIIASNFNPNTLQEFFNTFVEQSLILINKLEKVGQDGNEIIFFEHIKRRALDIACGKDIY